MANFSTNQFKAGLKLMIDGEPCNIIDNEIVKPGKGQAFNRIKIRKLISGKVLEKTYKSGESVEGADVMDSELGYLYADGEFWHFMNNETFEQLNLNNDIVENKYLYLTSNQEVTIQMYGDTPIDLVLPPTVNLLVTSAEPAVKGDTVSSSTKSVTCETGLILNVPMFIEEDELIKVDTKNSSYMTRVQ